MYAIRTFYDFIVCTAAQCQVLPETDFLCQCFVAGLNAQSYQVWATSPHETMEEFVDLVDQINQQSTNAPCAQCGSHSHATAQCMARLTQGCAPAHNNNNQCNQCNNNNCKAPLQPCFHCSGNH